jgi:hypothetical protein
LLGVVALAVALAVFLYLQFLGESRRLWGGTLHDRNAHLYSGLCLATDARQGRILQLVSDLDKFRTWPPFHDGLLVGTALLLGGGDDRWAVLPSLLGFVGTAVFAFLLVRRALPTAGTCGGILAAVLVLASPAMKAYALDVMLESVGACLTLMSLYFYLLVRQSRSRLGCWGLALTLTALFLHKYNYWGLVVAALVVDQACLDPRGRLRWLRDHVWTRETRAWMVRQLYRPLNYLFAALVVAIAIVEVTGGTTLELFGRTVSVRSTANLVTIAYAVLMIRPAIWFWRRGRALVRQSGPVTAALVYGHAFPMALWFLWPHRLYSFLWVSNPGSNVGEYPRFDLLGGYADYWSWLTGDYHVGVWGVGAVVVLLGVASWAGLRGRLRPGAAAVLWLVVVAFVLVAHHPNRKSRFLHSWIATAWVAAGVGAGSLLRPRPGATGLTLRTGFAGLLATAAVMHLPELVTPGRAPEGGVPPSGPSSLDVTDNYLPLLADSRRTAVFSNMPMKFLAQWTFMQRYPAAQRLETDVKGFDSQAPDNRRCFSEWLAATNCDTVVYIDVPPGTKFHAVVPGCDGLGQYGELLASQTVFTRVHGQVVSETGCVVTVWKRARPSDPLRAVTAPSR